MKRLIVLISTVFLGLLIISSCGELAGNDPEGVTGGHEGGYGSFGTGYSGYDYDYILGNWRHVENLGDYHVLIFHSDGTLVAEFFNSSGIAQYTQTGTYFISGNRLDFNVSGWQSGSGTVTFGANTLTLTREDAATDYQRVR